MEQYRLSTIAFYNVENLFDTENDTLVYDDDRTPEGKDKWTMRRYEKKIEDISKVISGIGQDLSNTAPDIIGLCEVENQKVIEDLIHHPNLISHNYGIVHMDSPDERGIDVALLYKKAAFLPVSFSSHRLLLFNDHQLRDYTRDQLVVSGVLDDEVIHFIVNHWPSRSGGEARSRPYRLAAAKLNKRIIDSILEIGPVSKIISIGDFNDNPLDDSLKIILGTAGEKESTTPTQLFNPMEILYKQGSGSLAYRDIWSLFDQILLSGNMVNTRDSGYAYWKAGIYNPDFLITQSGRYKGYPFRTYTAGAYTGGYSDHFPVYITLLKKAD
jgi:hypothetical protein